MIFLIESKQSKYPLDGFLAQQIENKMDSIDFNLFRKLYLFENFYNRILTSYENNNYYNIISFESDINNIIKQLNLKELKENNKEIFYYVILRVSDINTYLYYSKNKVNNNNLGDLKNVILSCNNNYKEFLKDMEEEISSYSNNYFKDSDKNKSNIIKAYIYNTIIFNDNILKEKNIQNNNDGTLEEFLDEYLKILKDYKWNNEVLGRYYRNLGNYYKLENSENNKYDSQIENAYELSIKADNKESKIYEVYADFIIKKFEDKKLKNRNNVYLKLDSNIFKDESNNINQCIEYYSIAKMLNPKKYAAQFKLAKVYIYLYLGDNDKNNLTIAYNELHLLELLIPTNVGLKFNLRSYYEAIGDYAEAKRINDLIPKNNNNDVEYAGKLYAQEIENNK